LLAALAAGCGHSENEKAIAEFRERIAADQDECRRGNGGACSSVKEKIEILQAVNNHDLAALRRMCNPMNLSACAMFEASGGKSSSK
jgi:hypothetical protein